MKTIVQPKQLLWLTQAGLTVMHSLYLSHLREIADGSRRLAIAICAAFCVQPTTVSPGIGIFTLHAASYSDVATNTTVISCTIGAHAPAVFPGCLS